MVVAPRQFLKWREINDLLKREYILRHSNVRCDMGVFDVIFNEDSMCTVKRAVIIFINHK